VLADDQPTAIGGQADVGPVLRGPALAEDLDIVGRIVAEPVQEDVAVVILLALGDAAGRW